jgi:inosine/xanthosine triphosphate pyrophosphatase family protein
MTKEERIQRGLAAKALMDSGVFIEALKYLEAAMSEEWKSSRPDDAIGRERLYLMTQIMADLGRVLRQWSGEAAFEVHEIERRQQEQHIN